MTIPFLKPRCFVPFATSGKLCRSGTKATKLCLRNKKCAAEATHPKYLTSLAATQTHYRPKSHENGSQYFTRNTGFLGTNYSVCVAGSFYHTSKEKSIGKNLKKIQNFFEKVLDKVKEMWYTVKAVQKSKLFEKVAVTRETGEIDP